MSILAIDEHYLCLCRGCCVYVRASLYDTIVFNSEQADLKTGNETPSR